MKASKPSHDWMHDAFIEVQGMLASNLNLARKSFKHPDEKGGVGEDHWAGLLRDYLPNRYDLAVRSTIIDSRGERSDQIDIVIFDRHFTPTLLTQKRQQYIPAEAVYVVLESKPMFTKSSLEYAARKAASVRRLHRTSAQITHAGGRYAKPKKPFPIVAGILAREATWADGLGKAFHDCLASLPENHRLDCGCAIAKGAFDNFDGGDALKVVPAQGALIYFLFRLLAKLQSLGTVPAIDWGEYAKTINP